MDLRDYFAGQALAGMLAQVGVFDSRLPADSVDELVPYTQTIYRIADAMLKARALNDTPQNVDTNTIADTLVCYGSARICITSAGNVGTTAPNGILAVSNAAEARGTFLFP